MKRNESEKDYLIRVDACIKLDSYKIVSDAISAAISYGIKRAYKHTDSPTKESICEEIHRSIMNDLCDILKFEE